MTASTRSSHSQLMQHLDLLLMLTLRDIKIRYKQSVMGFLWAVLMPILVIGSGLIVMVAFATMSGRAVDQTAVLSVAVKSVPWAFFVAAIRFSTNSLVMNKELVTKIYFPREILPLASVLASAVDFGVGIAVLTIVMCILKVGVSLYLVWVPVLILLLLFMATGLALLLSCANLFYRDIKYLVDVVLTYGVFITPVFYSPDKLGKLGKLLLINPVGPILEGLNAVVIQHRAPDLAWLMNSAVWAIAGSILFWWTFNRAEASFAERI